MPIDSLVLTPLGRNLLPWVAGSTVCYALATILLALALRRSRPHGHLSMLARSPGGMLAGWLLWMIWLVGPGYVALVIGILSPRMMGLTQIDLGTGLGLGALFAVFALGVLLAAGVTYRRLRHTHSASVRYPSTSIAAVMIVRLLLESGALQWHWAFYRSAFIAAIVGVSGSNPIYWGAWLAVGWICLEGAASPFLWQDLRSGGRAEMRILRGVLLIVATVVYLLSRNFWLTWALHALTIVLVEPRLRISAPPEVDNKKGPRQQDRHQRPV